MLNFALEGDALDNYNKMVEELKRKAMSELGLLASEIVVRPLRPEDMGFSTPQWTKTVAWSGTNAWNKIVNTVTVADNRFIGINGVHRGTGQGTTTQFTQLRVTRSGKLARYWNIQAVEDFIGNSQYFNDYITVDQNNQLTVEGYALATTVTEKMVFLGAVAEKRGLVLNPNLEV